MLVALLLLNASCNESDNSDNTGNTPNEIETGGDYEGVVQLAERQLEYAVHCADSAAALPENQEKGFYLPVGMDAQGNYLISSAYDWRSGFFPGCCWYMYELTNKEEWKLLAEKYTLSLEKAATYSQHDLGFMFNNSYGKGYKLTNDTKYVPTLLEAAKTLSGRYWKSVGCLLTWNPFDQYQFPVLIDAMMNLELLFEATSITGDSLYYQMAVSHAEKTMKHHFREDNSSFHIVSYNIKTGEPMQKFTMQGYSDDSYWSRGQSWGLYGFTSCYRYTNDERFLKQACKIADFLLSLDYPSDLIPYWDMKCPDIPNTARDASAAAIMASALLELSGYVDDSLKVKYRNFAINQITNLAKYYTSVCGENNGFLLLHSTAGSDETGNSVDIPTIYADYYYLECLSRLRKTGQFN